jgi:iron(II)-dependent oxidoreductase
MTRLPERLKELLLDEELAAPNPLRGRAGLALGRLGDPREDVRCPVPTTVLIPAEPFIMGSKKGNGPGEDSLAYGDEEPRHEVKKMPAYRIGKYPVTVAQFRRFVDAEGYDPEQSGGYWQGGGFEWLRKSGQRAPVSGTTRCGTLTTTRSSA